MYREVKRRPYFPREDVSIGLWRVAEQEAGHMHDHDFVEIAIVEAGRGMHRFGEVVLPIETGDLFILPPGYHHAWVETHTLTVTNVMIAKLEDLPLLAGLRRYPAFDALFGHEPNLANQREGRGRLKLDLGQVKEVKGITQRLCNSLHEPATVPAVVVEIQLMYLLTILCDTYARAPERNRRLVLRATHVVRYLEDHFNEPVECDQLADHMHVSRSTFYRLFKQATGTTPIQYVNRLRVERARDLLRTTDDTVGRIADAVGFNDASYFARLFGKQVGMSPQEYRGWPGG